MTGAWRRGARPRKGGKDTVASEATGLLRSRAVRVRILPVYAAATGFALAITK